jgi:hypothetical protein
MCAIGWTGEAVIISSVDPAGRVIYWWQPQNETDWPQQVVAEPLSVTGRYNSYTEPSMAWTGEAVIIAASDVLGNLDYWWQPDGAEGWNPQHVAAAAADGGILYTQPSIAWADNSVAIAVSDNSGDLLRYWWQAEHETQWHPVGLGTALQPSVAYSDDDVIIAAVDQEGSVKFWWLTPKATSSQAPQTVASWSKDVTYSQPVIAWTGSDRAAVIAAVDNTGNLHYWWQAKGASGWNPQLVASAVGQARYSRPSIAWTGTAVVITAVDSLGNLHYWWQPHGATGWNPQLVSSGAENFVKYDFPAIAWAGTSKATNAGAVVIVAKSFNSAGGLHQINYFWQPHGATGWNPETVATYAPIT